LASGPEGTSTRHIQLVAALYSTGAEKQMGVFHLS
jgi:hypothetical protein